MKNLGYVVWLVMLVMAIVFFQERAFFLDAGFQLFNLINEEAIQIYHYRFITVVPQILPYFLLKINAPLWALAVAYSASYILFFLLAYHVLVHYLKNIELGWVLVFLFTLISLDTFYHIQSEFYLGLALLILSFGVVLENTQLNKKWQWPILLILLLTIAFSHKLTLIFFVFLWSFFWINNKGLRHKNYFLFLMAFIISAAIKSIYFTNWYEAAKQADFKTNLWQYFPHFYTLPSNLVFLERCVHYYYMLPILMAVVTVFYISKKQWLKMGIVWTFTIGFILLYNISDPGAIHRFYSEVTYLPLIIFVAVPFMFDVFPVLAKRIKWLPAIIGVVIFLRLSVISLNHQVFKNNHIWIYNQFKKAEALNTNRLLIKSENAPQDTIIMEWGVPFTAMHLSALDKPTSAKTILIMPEFNWYLDKMNEDDLFFSPFHKVIKNGKLNSQYYNLKNGKYIEVE